jgi:large subunit ribosomal protein L7Ae
VESKKPVVVKFGINHITYLVEQGKAGGSLTTSV